MFILFSLSQRDKDNLLAAIEHMEQKYIDRLLVLRQNLVDYHEGADEYENIFFRMSTWFEKNTCQTVCCAAGLYVSQNPGCGLELKFTNQEATVSHFTIFDGVQHGYRALADHFGLDNYQTVKLFDFQSYYNGDGPMAVVKNIDSLLADK